MQINRSIAWSEGMSRERFVQEAALRAMQVFLDNALLEQPDSIVDEDFADRIAKLSREMAFCLDEAMGTDNLPRTRGEV